jgi:glycosyltransferase involved in cell wall biosynthesis
MFKVMKIVFIGQKGIPAINGGVEKQVEELLVHLASRGHEISAYARSNYAPGLKEYKGVKIISLPFIKGKHFEAISHTFFSIIHVVFKKVDIIHVQSIGPASLIWLLKILKPKTPIVFTFHCQDYNHKKWGKFARWFLLFGEKMGCKLADQTFTTSKELTQYTKDKYNNSAMYMPAGINPSKSHLVADKIKSWGLEKDNYILSVSRLVKHKGIHYLIEAFKEIKTDKKLVIAGDGAYTDDYVKELQDLAKDDKRIIFTGNLQGNTLSELYNNAYLFVQASEYEGLSMALVEAMSYGLPCLTSNIPSNLEGLGGLGFSFENKNVADLKNKLEYTLANPELVKKEGNKLKERVLKEYHWPTIVEQTIKVYKKLLDQKS